MPPRREAGAAWHWGHSLGSALRLCCTRLSVSQGARLQPDPEGSQPGPSVQVGQRPPAPSSSRSTPWAGEGVLRSICSPPTLFPFSATNSRGGGQSQERCALCSSQAHLLLHAVSSCRDPLWGQQGACAPLLGLGSEADLPRPGPQSAGFPPCSLRGLEATATLCTEREAKERVSLLLLSPRGLPRDRSAAAGRAGAIRSQSHSGQ